ncbi:hypothetical protein B1R32_1397, partial [Abditibacterium utsteinense]
MILEWWEFFRDGFKPAKEAVNGGNL